ncbi:reverse transcriptase [Tanacetum coccineum]|uniref:Reverse transcriptase n=1 Tax=Tanacetum coccineum TaxID=301880 RepID=A0ABQ5D321_9ASTR
MVSTCMDDATKQFINEAIQEAITAAMIAIQQRIDGVCSMVTMSRDGFIGVISSFILDNVAENQKVKIASIHLYDKALDWHRNFERRHGLEVTWERYSEEVLNRFGAVVKDPTANLKNLRKTSTIKVYQDQFDALLSKVDITESQAISMFLGGMSTDIAMMVRMFKPRTLTDTYCLVNLQEVANESRTKSNQYIQVIEMLLALVLVVMVEMFVLEVLATPDEEGEELIREECLAEEISHTEIQELLEEFDDVFVVPKCLPLNGSLDHRIPLKEGVTAVNIKPYRYPPVQKDTIEAMVKELLDSGMIGQSNSAFSSPIVMVKNVADRVLHRFPCLHLLLHREELIDELYGSKVFLKLDLRSGYHQIRMSDEDIYKTDFKTHDGHYEFLVMPFGLTNAPSTFQALMNNIFRPFLRKFTLVFLDDILVYSSSIEDHVQHLRQVLKVMRKHTLYAKMSKCVFGTTQVEYLGQVISQDGVATDPTRKFIKGYALITQPLTTLLKNNAFNWNDQATESFHALQQAMVQSLVLALPNFEKEFIIETDASGYGGTSKNSKYTWSANELRRKGKLVVVNDEQLRLKLISHFHDSPTGGHSSMQATMKRLAAYFYWKGLKKMVKQQIHLFDICQRNKPGLSVYPGLLQPLQILNKVWQDISMDFIEALPIHPFTAVHVAQAFLDNVYKLHGLPSTIMSDRDKARERVIAMLKLYLKAAQDKMKAYADKKRSDKESAVGNLVYLKVQPYRQLTLRVHKQHKLFTKFFGPFKVLQKVEKVAYKLELPSTTQIHLVFHVSQLKKCHSTDLSMGSLPLCDSEGSLAVIPYKILDRKLAKQGTRVVIYGMI